MDNSDVQYAAQSLVTRAGAHASRRPGVVAALGVWLGIGIISLSMLRHTSVQMQQQLQQTQQQLQQTQQQLQQIRGDASQLKSSHYVIDGISERDPSRPAPPLKRRSLVSRRFCRGPGELSGEFHHSKHYRTCFIHT